MSPLSTSAIGARRGTVAGLFAVLSLGACDRPDVASGSGAGAAAQVRAPAGVRPAPTGMDLRRVCKAGLASIHGQQPQAIDVDGVEGGVVHASWRAPVDGGRMRADCRLEPDRLLWKPLGLPDAALIRWMDQPGDPVIHYAVNAQDIVITQTLPDGTTERANLAVPAEEEAR